MGSRSRRVRLVLLTVTFVWALLTVAWLWKLGGRTQDDFYISFTYARNLVEGNGFVFNPGERVFGLTNPGFTLLLALLHVVTSVPIHLLGSLVSGISLLLVAILLGLEAERANRLLEGVIGGTLIVSCSFLWSHVGGEWTCALALMLIGAKLAEAHPVSAGLLLGLAVWFRPEAGLGVAILGCLLWFEKRRLPWRFGVAAALTITAGMTAAWLYFWTFVPNTLAAKQAMAAAGELTWSGDRFWLRLVPLAERHYGTIWRLLALAGLLGLVPWWLRAGRGGRLLISYAIALAAYYPLSGVEFFSWYVAPCLLVLLIGVAYFVCSPLRLLARVAPPGKWPLAAGVATAAVLCFLLLRPWAMASVWWYRHFDGYRHLETYTRAALWLAEEIPRQERVAYVEIGVLGYFGRHPVQDLMGLVSPEVLPFVERGDIVGAFLVRPTEVVIFHSRGRMGPIVASPWFPRIYEEVAFFEEVGPLGEPRGLKVYRKREGAALPTAHS